MALAEKAGVRSKAIIDGLVWRPSMRYVRTWSPPAKSVASVDEQSRMALELFSWESSIPSASDGARRWFSGSSWHLNTSSGTFEDVTTVQFLSLCVWFVYCTRSWENITRACEFDYVTFSQDHCQPSDCGSSLLLDLVYRCGRFWGYLRRIFPLFFSATLSFF